MILFCRYGTDASAPEKGYVAASYQDGAAIPVDAHRDTLRIQDPGPVGRFGLFGPAPQLHGDAPTAPYPSHAEMDAAKVPQDHKLRRLAGLPMPDNRRPGRDNRRPAAPDLTVDLARAARAFDLEEGFAAACVAGFPSAKLGAPHTYASDAVGLDRLRTAGMAALSGQGVDGWTALLSCVDTAGEKAARPHTAIQVHAVLRDYQAFSDDLHAKHDALAAQIAAATTVAEALAVTWA